MNRIIKSKFVMMIRGIYLKIEGSRIAAKLKALIGKIPILKNFNHLSLRKRRMITTALLLIVVILTTITTNGFFFGETEAKEYTEYEVARNNIIVSISGSGTVEPIKRYDVVATVSGEVLEDTFEEGDEMKEGDLLYTIDSSEMEKTLAKADISLEKSQMSFNSSMDAYYGLTVTAPISGRISEIFVEKGDNVQSGSRVATIVDDSSLTAKVPFNTNDISSLSLGETVSVTLENTFETISGTITNIYNSKRVLDGYITVTDVEVTITNPGALIDGTYVTVTANGVSCHEPGILEYVTEQYITAGGSGSVSKITAPEGTYLSKGASILTLTSGSSEDTLRSSQLSLQEAELSYGSTLEQLDNYSITSPISGSVISKTIKEGDTLDGSSGNTVMAVIADMSTMTFKISVDELDIASMKKGQTVSITADALENNVFTGYVSNIGLLGSSANGVTTYPVTIVIDNPDGLWPGMNITADIVVNSVENVIAIPVAAVNRGNLVLVKESSLTEENNITTSLPEERNRDTISTEGVQEQQGMQAQGGMEEQAGTEALTGGAISNPGDKTEENNVTPNINRNAREIDQSEAPDGYKYVQVTLGINDDSYIEIISGLAEGNVILVPAITTETTNTDAIMPGMGVGMPAGGAMTVREGPPNGINPER